MATSRIGQIQRESNQKQALDYCALSDELNLVED